MPSSPRRPLKEPSLEDAWQTAEQRALLYLKSLQVPPKQALECALKALLAAEQGPTGNPAADTMRALRAILREERVLPDEPEMPLPRGQSASAVQVAPPIHRGVMVPSELDRRPWVAATARVFRGIKSLVSRVLTRRKS
jgi:hypothetical protein